MDRIATCSSCGTRFRVPPTVTGARAKCSKCGGVVEIGAAPPPAAPAERPKPVPDSPAAAGVPPAPEHSRHTAGIRRARLLREAHGHHAPAKKTPIFLWGCVAALAAAASAGAYVLKNAGRKPTQVAKAPASLAAPAGEAKPPSPATSQPSPLEPEAVEPAERPAPPASKPKRPPKKRIVEDVDLSQIPDVPEESTTGPDLAEEIRKSVALLLDPDAGAKGTRAQNRLIEIGKPAFPAILNALKHLDYATEEGMRTGSMVNHVILERMAGGRGLDYRADTGEESVKWNRQVAKQWIQYYLEARDDAEAWKRFTNQAPAGKEGEKKKAEDDLGLDKVGPG